MRVLPREGVSGGNRLLTLRRRLRGWLRRCLWMLCRDDIHRRQVLAGKAVVLLARFVQEHAVTVGALFVAEVGGAVFGGAELSS